MHYTGTLHKTGSKFDSSLDRKSSFDFILGTEMTTWFKYTHIGRYMIGKAEAEDNDKSTTKTSSIYPETNANFFLSIHFSLY